MFVKLPVLSRLDEYELLLLFLISDILPGHHIFYLTQLFAVADMFSGVSLEGK